MNIICSDRKNICSQLSFFGKKETPHCYADKTPNTPADSFKRNNPESISICNFHTIDEFVSRGGQPTEQQIAELKRNGYTDIISFSLEFDETAPWRLTNVRDQAKWAEKNDIQFHWLPSYASKNPTKENVEKFLSIADDVRENNKKLFICCERGSDRTGVYSAIYEMTYNKVSGKDAIKTMLKYGHNYYLFDNLIPFVKDYEKRLKTKNITNKIKNFFLHPFK